MNAPQLVGNTSRAPRSKPIHFVGAVNVLAPVGTSPYYRLTWTQPDGVPGRTSGGRTLTSARAKAAEINDSLARAAGARAMTPLSVITDEYLSSPVGRNQKTEGDWSASQLKQMRPRVRRITRGHGESLAMEVDRKLLDKMRSQGGTRRTRKENATCLRGLLRWGATRGYFSPEQAELLPVKVYDLAGEIAGTEAPKRRTRVRQVGESEIYLSNEDAPSKQQIVDLGRELQLRWPSGQLATELAADAGARWGELFQLTANDVVSRPSTTSRTGKRGRARLHLVIDFQIDPASQAGGKRRKPPKGNKRRKAGVSEISITGFRLHEALLSRVTEALQEQADGRNPEALLFPTVNGDLFFHTAFSNDYFKPAAIAAGWPYQEWVYVGHRWNEREERWFLITEDRLQFDLTWHSLRHRYARTCVDIRKLTAGQLMAHGGWENETVVKNLYYNTGEEHFESGADKF